MKRSMLALAISCAVSLGGCAAMEQYHFPQTQDKVPVKVIVAFSDKYPNQTITSITEQKMFDGSKRYQIVMGGAKTPNGEATATFTEDGDPVPSPM